MFPIFNAQCNDDVPKQILIPSTNENAAITLTSKEREMFGYHWA